MSALDRDYRIKATQVEGQWLPYPENEPFNGWCATTDGGNIKLTFWSDGKWKDGDREIVEFMQVTVNVPN